QICYWRVLALVPERRVCDGVCFLLEVLPPTSPPMRLRILSSFYLFELTVEHFRKRRQNRSSWGQIMIDVRTWFYVRIVSTITNIDSRVAFEKEETILRRTSSRLVEQELSLVFFVCSV